MTEEEKQIYDSVGPSTNENIKNVRHFVPIQWANQLLSDARTNNDIACDMFLNMMLEVWLSFMKIISTIFIRCIGK